MQSLQENDNVSKNKQSYNIVNTVTFKHEKDDVREIREGFECGIGVRDFNDFEEGDILVCFIEETVALV